MKPEIPVLNCLHLGFPAFETLRSAIFSSIYTVCHHICPFVMQLAAPDVTTSVLSSGVCTQAHVHYAIFNYDCRSVAILDVLLHICRSPCRLHSRLDPRLLCFQIASLRIHSRQSHFHAPLTPKNTARENELLVLE
jgi:hypothetical protein